MAEQDDHPVGKMGTRCGVHIHRERVPMERHHIWPLGMGGPDTPDNIVTVCSNGHGSIHAYLNVLIDWQGAPPWTESMRYGWKVRTYARRGYLESRGR